MEEVGSILPMLLAVGALLIAGIIFLRGRPLLAGVGLSIALILLLLSVEHFTRLGLSYDLVARSPIRLYIPEAPVTAVLGLIYLALLASMLVCGILAIVFSRAFWIKTVSWRGMLSLAFIPALFLYVYQVSQAKEVRRHAEAQDHHAQTDRKAVVMDIHRVRGERWAYEHQLEHEDGCKPGAQGPEDQPGFLEGCAQAVHSRLRTMGENWAASQPVFNIEDCRPGYAGAKDDPDFMSGCQYHVGQSSSSRLLWDGINFARNRHIRRVAECSTSVPNAPAEFVTACEKEVRLPRQEEGKRWAQLKQTANEDDCNQPEWQARQPEEKADLIRACRDEVIEQRVVAGRRWAWNNGTSVEDCQSDLGGVQHNPQFVQGCEEIMQHRLKHGR